MGLCVGRVAGAHGIRGQIRIRWGGDGPETLLRLERLWLVPPGGRPAGEAIAVRRVAPGRAGEVRMALEGIGSREEAEALRGLEVHIEESQLAELQEDEFYWFQLIGCRVFGSEEQPGSQAGAEETEAPEREIGVVRELWETGAHDVLVVEDEQGRRHLIPTARELVREIDVEAGRIRVRLIPGLLEGDAPDPESESDPGSESPPESESMSESE